MTTQDPGFPEIGRIRGARREYEIDLRNASPVYAQQVELMRRVYGANQEENGLNQVQRILIALGMAINSGHPSSVEWCITRALNHRATKQMILDAVDVALLNGGTFAVHNARLVIEVLDSYGALRGAPDLSNAGSERQELAFQEAVQERAR
jgi:alkylhydroperoxidase/carboxymuconolactone decarboxylase family protein YurZ